MSLLAIEDLFVDFMMPDGAVNAVNGFSCELQAGQTLGIVGESGSGKTQAMLSILGLLASNGRTRGRVIFQGMDLLNQHKNKLNKIRGNRIAMIFQDPMTCLNPYKKIGRQLAEVLQLHRGLSFAAARRGVLEMLDAVKISEPLRRFDQYPHEFSGGMRQRVMIAMALLCRPDLLIADEPTTALDVTVQAQILSLLKDLQKEFKMAIILITHDLGVVAGNCDQVIVMYGGRVMEQAPVDELFMRPSHPYTKGLLASIPHLDGNESRLYAIPGSPPGLSNRPAGCPFSPRCAMASAHCKHDMPKLMSISANHARACHLALTEMGARA